MKNCPIFKPTPQYNELLILNLISQNNRITQRKIASKVSISSTMVNAYLEKFKKDGLIEKEYLSKKQVEYNITKKGKNRVKLLELCFIENAIEVFKEAKKELTIFLLNLQKKYKNIILYGAGEIAKTILFVIDATPILKLNILCAIDDDINKIGNSIIGKKIIGIKDINKFNYDCILISCYDYEKKIYNNLKKIGLDIKKIIYFFD